MLLDISLSLFALLCLCESGHYTLEIKTGDGSLGADGSLENTVFPEGAGLESLSLIIERANQSFIRMKSISTEADKAASEMEELISILQKFRVKDETTGVVTSNELGTTQPPLDVTGGSSEPAATETATDESNEEAEDGNDGESEFASNQPPLEEDVSSSGQIPEPTTDKSIEKAEDGNDGEYDFASNQPPLEEDVSSSGQIPEPTTDKSIEKAEDGNDGEYDFASNQPPLEEDVSSSGQIPEPTTDKSIEKAEDGNDGESDFASNQPPLEEDVSSSGQIPEPTTDKSIEKAEDGNDGESEFASTQPPLEEDVSSSGQIPESTTDESNEEAEDGTGPQGSTEPLTVFPEVDEEELPSNCHYNFTSQQIPGNPKSTCAAWLLNNYHKHNEGWRSCQDTGYHRYDESGLFGQSKLPF